MTCQRCGCDRKEHILPALYCPNPARPYDLYVAARTPLDGGRQ